MCRRVMCKSCGKPNWAGCGAHVDMVLADVPKAERCRCRETGTPKVSASKAGAAQAPAPDTAIAKFKLWLKK